MIEPNYVLDLSVWYNRQLSLGVVVFPDYQDTLYRNLIDKLRERFYSAAEFSQFVCRGTLLRFNPISQLIELGIRRLFRRKLHSVWDTEIFWYQSCT